MLPRWILYKQPLIAGVYIWELAPPSGTETQSMSPNMAL
jgi:hypothetical protein